MFENDTSNLAAARQLREVKTESYVAREMEKVTGRIPQYNPNKNDELLARVKHVLKKGERLMEFYARTSIGPCDIMSLSKDELKRRVELCDQNQHDAGLRKTFAARQRPTHVVAALGFGS